LGATDAAGAALKRVAPGRFRVEGDLDLTTVAALARAGRQLAAGAETAPGPVEVDLSGVSAAIALLLEWLEQAAAGGVRLEFRNWPEALVRIADFSNVDALLGVHGPPRIGPPGT
jgi:phospholipid transport system transporter-binding protein